MLIVIWSPILALVLALSGSLPSSSAAAPAAASNISKVYVVFSNHFDCGYTLDNNGSTSGAVVNQYFHKHFPAAIAAGRAARAHNSTPYKWMTQVRGGARCALCCVYCVVYILCAVCCVLCAVRCVRCAVLCAVPCDVCCHVPCAVCRVLCVVCSVLCCV